LPPSYRATHNRAPETTSRCVVAIDPAGCGAWVAAPATPTPVAPSALHDRTRAMLATVRTSTAIRVITDMVRPPCNAQRDSAPLRGWLSGPAAFRLGSPALPVSIDVPEVSPDDRLPSAFQEPGFSIRAVTRLVGHP